MCYELQNQDLNENLIAKVEAMINAPVSKVWDALVSPEAIKTYIFGTTVISEWKKGSSIIWKGDWQGKQYEDKGKILQFKKQKILKYSHFSPLSGVPDQPENYHIVTIKLSKDGADTLLTLTQDHNATKDELEHSKKNWMMMLEGLKKLLEQ